MTAPLFWVAPEALAGAVTGGTVTLSGAEAHHAASVQRLRVGETVLVSDAVGLRAQASVTAVRGGASPLVDLRLDGIEQVARR
ncbi:MAG: hypothetical protein LBE08_10555, partial [Bifidobacteriaceae bacterium]|nr:hypothetical protein [Bifidobacteriaceae bacterium]